MSNWLGGLLGGDVAIPPSSSIIQQTTNVNSGSSKPSKQTSSQASKQTSSHTSSKSSNKKKPVEFSTPSGNKLLLLLDMNGTLLLRLKGKLGNAPPAFTHAGLNYFIREGVYDLVRVCRFVNALRLFI